MAGVSDEARLIKVCCGTAGKVRRVLDGCVMEW